MKLTSILKALFDSGGDGIYIGDTRLDGITIDNSGEVLTVSTVSSEVDLAGLRIYSSSLSPAPGEEVSLIATAKIAFDSYHWEASGAAVFIGGIQDGKEVLLSCATEDSITLTLSATIGDQVRNSEAVINFTKGFQASQSIVGPSLLDFTDPVRYLLQSNYGNETVIWSITGGGSITSPTNTDVYVIANETGDDIILQAVITVPGYYDNTINMSIEVAKCEMSSGGVDVERPFVYAPRNTIVEEVLNVETSNFIGVNTASTVSYQIDVTGGDFLNPIVLGDVGYVTSFVVDRTLLDDGASYVIRIRFEDNTGAKSFWSEESAFSTIS